MMNFRWSSLADHVYSCLMVMASSGHSWPSLSSRYCCTRLLYRSVNARHFLLSDNQLVRTGYSRISDFKHHWQDVLCGAVIGSLVAFVTFKFILQWTFQERRFLPYTVASPAAPPPALRPIVPQRRLPASALVQPRPIF
jgi:hypothetical protein